MKQIIKLTSQLPFMLTMGNHETRPDLLDYEKRFLMPNYEATKNHYYSFGVNNVHFINLNSNLFEKPIPKEFNSEYTKTFQDWIKNDLKNVPAGVWIIVFMHKPLYCSYNKDNCMTETVEMRKIYEQILNDAKVDLIVAGHVHVYERELPVGDNGKIDTESVSKDKSTYTNPKYPAHVVCGAAGQVQGIKKTPYKFDMQKYTHIAIGNHPGVCEFSVSADGKKLKMDYVNVDNGKVVDSFEIVKTKRRKMKRKLSN